MKLKKFFNILVLIILIILINLIFSPQVLAETAIENASGSVRNGSDNNANYGSNSDNSNNTENINETIKEQ